MIEFMYTIFIVESSTLSREDATAICLVIYILLGVVLVLLLEMVCGVVYKKKEKHCKVSVDLSGETYPNVDDKEKEGH